MKKIVITIILIYLTSFNVNGQINAKASELPSKITYQTLSKMDRDALINLAKSKLAKHLEIIKEEPFNYTGVDVKVLKNSKEFAVYFEQSFKYVPLHTAHYYGFYVYLLEDNISRFTKFNEATSGKFSYYSPSSQDLEKIAFVKKAISYKEGRNVLVNEKENHYEIGFQTSGMKLDKKTGEEFDFWDRICAPPTDPLIEILADPCPTQEDFKQSFAHLKKIILKKGEKRRYEGDDYPTTFYTYNDMGFSYRNIASDSKYLKEIIHVTGSDSYWIIKEKGTYVINVKDYSEEIAKQKRKAALEHFCTQLLNLKK